MYHCTSFASALPDSRCDLPSEMHNLRETNGDAYYSGSVKNITYSCSLSSLMFPKFVL